MQSVRPFFNGLPYGLLLLGVIVGLLALAILIVRKLRGSAGNDEPGSTSMLTKFRDLHAKGELSEAEFRTIKTKLSAQIHQQLKDTEETG